MSTDHEPDEYWWAEEGFDSEADANAYYEAQQERAAEEGEGTRAGEPDTVWEARGEK
jgi:hypothetical protein